MKRAIEWAQIVGVGFVIGAAIVVVFLWPLYSLGILP